VRVPGQHKHERAERAGDSGAQQAAATGQAEAPVPLVAQHSEGGGSAHEPVGGPWLAALALGHLLRCPGASGEMIGDVERGDAVQGLGPGPEGGP
jgi:hypothetical protein